jgi:putative spermidine/putrescine transport system permease protein
MGGPAMKTRTGDLAFSFYCWLVYAFLLAPILIVVLASFNSGAFLTFPPKGFSFRWYAVFFDNEVFHRAIVTSLWVASISTIISGCIGTAAAIYHVCYAGRAKEAVRLTLLAPLLLPEVLTAIALLFFFYTLGIGTRGMVGLVVGHVLLTLPFVFMNVSASLESFDPDWDLAARSLGAGRITRFRRIMLPMIKPGVIGGCLFAFIISFDTFTMSFLLKSVGTSTLPIQLFDYLKTNFTPEAAAVSSFSVALTLVVVVFTEKVLGLKIRRF